MEKKNIKETEKNVKVKLQKVTGDFKQFIMRGNVLDLAVGVIIGGAFGKIVTSLVNDILMPLIGVLLGGLDFTNLTFTIKDAVIKYGVFIQNIIDFLIIALSIFIFIKIVNSFTKKHEEEPQKEVVPDSKEVILLQEIRDLLKQNKKTKKD